MVPNVPPVGDIPKYSGDPARIAALNTDSVNYPLELDADLNSLQTSLASQGLTPTFYRVDTVPDTDSPTSADQPRTTPM